MWRMHYAIALLMFVSTPAFAGNLCKRYIDASLIGDGGSELIFSDQPGLHDLRSSRSQ
jgi:hypothetical protein